MSVGIGASAVSVGNYMSDNVVKAVEELLKASRKTIVVDESFQDVVKVASGSGPTYYSRFVGAIIEGAKELRFFESDAKTLVIQTITGAAGMLTVERASLSRLRENVTSPKETTFAAL